VAARAQGRVGGRPVSLSAEDKQQAIRLLANGHTRKQLSLIYNTSLSTVYKYLPVRN
uniref:helix-turn-helix domain-containing protein n=1 Tax=Photorhabdus sp. RM323S TaxID=3342828 RepID=UPI0036D8D987